MEAEGKEAAEGKLHMESAGEFQELKKSFVAFKSLQETGWDKTPKLCEYLGPGKPPDPPPNASVPGWALQVPRI